MAKKISQLTQATEVKSDDVTVIVQDGETKKLPLNMMVTKQDIENKKVAGLAKLDEIEATYENDTYTPTITVKNKSSVKVGEGDGVDYSANVMDGHAKSAILKGNTLVNINNPTTINIDNRKVENGWQILTTWTDSYNTWGVKDITLFNPNTKYYIIVEVVENTLTTAWNAMTGKTDTIINTAIHSVKFEPLETGIKYGTFTTKSDFTGVIYGLCSATGKNEVIGKTLKYRVMILEYQEGMENWDIPFFEGMQSVKMPVLKTTGKNLCDGVREYNGANDVYGTNFIKVEEGKKYGIYQDDKNFLRIDGYSNNKEFVTSITGGNVGLITIPSGVKYIKWKYPLYGEPYNENSKIMIALSDRKLTLSDYEPYKSNILTTPSDLTLRGIGDVKDTLDCLTGEVVERVGEVVLDGSESWTKYQNTFYTRLDTLPRVSDYTSIIMCSDLPVVPAISHLVNANKGVTGYTKNSSYVGENWVYVKFEDVNDVDALKMKLSENPITVQYHLANESIKTVDLIPSGTHPSTTPYCWKDGHIQLSSSGLLPSLEYSVVTSRAGQIGQNAAMIVKNDKRIFDLEILLAGGLVNTTYQALTLQNQVETGLSKVSLSSETEPDYLLYHMIMKLIEEKAYKLDDLTEKVSVFYLYEKLSDEQFETIYSALYPFVEDEIVEEPVVEELPEVVEDEVIM